MNINGKIAKRMKELRVQKGMTAEKLAWYSGLSKSCISSAETGIKNIRVSTVEAICKGFEISIEEFFKGF